MDFFAMDGYARYVWSAFGISIVVLVALLWLTRRNFKVTKQALTRRLRSMENGRQ